MINPSSSQLFRVPAECWHATTCLGTALSDAMLTHTESGLCGPLVNDFTGEQIGEI